MNVQYQVILKKSVIKRIRKLPRVVQHRFDELTDVLAMAGPTGPHQWPHYGKLAGRDNEYHCHLPQYHVACWRHEKETITIEVMYVGSHEGAPY